MAITPTSVKKSAEQSKGVPPLEAGDLLSRPEFERRYDVMPHLKKAELIEGEVYMPSPVRWNYHAAPHADLIGWLFFYRAHTPGVRVGDNGSLRLDMENEPQADAAMIIEPSFGGQVKLEDDYVVGAPEWVGEVAASSASIDLHKKFRVYRRNLVREYLVWRVLDEAFDWFIARDGNFEPLSLSPAGYFQSEVFPGLWLDPVAMTRGDAAKVLQVLQQGLASTEHAAFAAKLKSAPA
jgi:Uma2 family endonuclease